MSIYFVEVLKRKYDSFDFEVIQSYPFPDVPLADEPISIEDFHLQLNLIHDKQQRVASINRFHFIINSWHTGLPAQLAIKDWKYERK